MRPRPLAVLAALAALAACSPPKSIPYKSLGGDFTATVPYGWNVMTESDGDGFAQVNFIGPFDSDFFLGAPSLSVRWFRDYRPHRLRDGRMEMYADGGDFIKQMLHSVYGDDSVLYGSGRREDGGREIVSKPETIVLKEAGLPARFFGVLSAAPAPKGAAWGVGKDEAGRPVNVRLHDYAVIPMDGGFYVLCYPATLRGHDKLYPVFEELVNTFHPFTAGPGGPKIRLPARAAQS